MRISRTLIAGVVAATMLTVSSAGCGSKPASSTSKPGSSTSATSSRSSASSSSAPAQAGGYAGLLIQASDIDAPPPVTFTADPPIQDPNGQPGVATTFKDEDGGHTIKDTIQIFADPAAATGALDAAKKQQGDVIKDPKTNSADIGTGGTVLSGDSPDHSKSVTILLFTQGKAFVTLEFGGPVEMVAPQDFVNGVGQKQDAAVKKGLGG